MLKVEEGDIHVGLEDLETAYSIIHHPVRVRTS
jgi:hypothetical protein